MVSDEFLKTTRCLATGSGLRRADAELLGRLNGAVSAGALRHVSGRLVTAPMDAALVNADQSLVYPVRNDVPQLVRNEAIELSQLGVEGCGDE